MHPSGGVGCFTISCHRDDESGADPLRIPAPERMPLGQICLSQGQKLNYR